MIRILSKNVINIKIVSTTTTQNDKWHDCYDENGQTQINKRSRIADIVVVMSCRCVKRLSVRGSLVWGQVVHVAPMEEERLVGGGSRQYGACLAVRRQEQPPPGKTIKHSVQPGDTLQGLALKYSTTVSITPPLLRKNIPFRLCETTAVTSWLFSARK